MANESINNLEYQQVMKQEKYFSLKFCIHEVSEFTEFLVIWQILSTSVIDTVHKNKHSLICFRLYCKNICQN